MSNGVATDVYLSNSRCVRNNDKPADNNVFTGRLPVSTGPQHHHWQHQQQQQLMTSAWISSTVSKLDKYRHKIFALCFVDVEEKSDEVRSQCATMWHCESKFVNVQLRSFYCRQSWSLNAILRLLQSGCDKRACHCTPCICLSVCLSVVFVRCVDMANSIGWICCTTSCKPKNHQQTELMEYEHKLH